MVGFPEVLSCLLAFSMHASAYDNSMNMPCKIHFFTPHVSSTHNVLVEGQLRMASLCVFTTGSSEPELLAHVVQPFLQAVAVRFVVPSSYSPLCSWALRPRARSISSVQLDFAKTCLQVQLDAHAPTSSNASAALLGLALLVCYLVRLYACP